MKPREFWITENGISDIYQASAVPPQNKSWTEQRFKIYVREVVPIDWDLIWSKYREDDIAALDTEQIEQLVEKQLKGEE